MDRLITAIFWLIIGIVAGFLGGRALSRKGTKMPNIVGKAESFVDNSINRATQATQTTQTAQTTQQTPQNQTRREY